MHALKPIEIVFKQIPWIFSHAFARVFHPEAVQFYKRLSDGAEPDQFLKVLPNHKTIYLSIPKAASTRIRQTLARVEGRFSRSLKATKRTRYRGPYSPRNISVGSFFKLASDPDTLRFSFVRNPYIRAVSCWANKFAGKPLVEGDFFINIYLAARKELDSSSPVGPDRTLSFGEFVHFAASSPKARYDLHLMPQADILKLSGIELDFIGKVETFDVDFLRVLDHLNAGDEIRRDAIMALNKSAHGSWHGYYTPELKKHVYRAYELDFDQFKYPSLMPS
jgi:Sulfotransferase family